MHARGGGERGRWEVEERGGGKGGGGGAEEVRQRGLQGGGEGEKGEREKMNKENWRGAVSFITQ